MELAKVGQGLQIKTVDFVVAKNGGIDYVIGAPKKVKFNGKDGKIYLGRNDETVSEILIVPIRLHIFTSEEGLYSNLNTQNWAELFFINQDGDVCSALFHGATKDNLIDAINYARNTKGLQFGAFSLEALPQVKKSPQGDYYVRKFNVKPLDTASYLDWITQNSLPVFNSFTILEWGVKNKGVKPKKFTPELCMELGKEMGIFY